MSKNNLREKPIGIYIQLFFTFISLNMSDALITDFRIF